jgi:hypothetical protein
MEASYRIGLANEKPLNTAHVDERETGEVLTISSMAGVMLITANSFPYLIFYQNYVLCSNNESLIVRC